jgi:hypothetical protein
VLSLGKSTILTGYTPDLTMAVVALQLTENGRVCSRDRELITSCCLS